MPRYPGEKICEGNNVYETRLSVDKLLRNPRMKQLVKPDIQCAQDEDKVEEMRAEYKEKPELFFAKNRLIIVDLDNKWYLIDGQHRHEMLKREFEINMDLQEHVQIVWYKYYNEEDVNALFKSINKDSIKNKNYIDVDTFVMIKINEFVNLLKNYHGPSFAKTKTAKGQMLTLEELRDNLKMGGFFKKPELCSLTSQELYNYFITKNDEFYNIMNYDTNVCFNKNIFYSKEIIPINEKIIFTLKNNNFVKWICQNDDENLSCVHYYKKEKTKIPSNMRTSVWRNYFGEDECGECPISYCKRTISRKGEPGMHCGHIISEKNGGLTNTNNLRPICGRCNCEMGDMNWELFDKKSFDTRSLE